MKSFTWSGGKGDSLISSKKTSLSKLGVFSPYPQPFKWILEMEKVTKKRKKKKCVNYFLFGEEQIVRQLGRLPSIGTLLGVQESMGGESGSFVYSAAVAAIKDVSVNKYKKSKKLVDFRM